MKQILFIYNPVAGTGKIKKNLYEIVEFYNNNDYLVTLYPVIKLNMLGDILKDEEQKYDIIVCSGGDGTISMLFSYYMQNNIKKPIAYIPSGSTNDYAYSLGIPDSFSEALLTTIQGQAKLFDIGKFSTDKYFLYVAAFGMFTDVSYNTPQKSKNMLGHAAYILEGIYHLSEIKSYQMVIKCDNQIYNDRFILGLVTNSLSIGGFKSIMPKDVELDDGRFEAILIKMPQNVIEIHNIISSLILESLDSNPYIIYCKTNQLEIVSDEEVAWTLDGEFGGRIKNVEIYNLRKEIEIIV